MPAMKRILALAALLAATGALPGCHSAARVLPHDLEATRFTGHVLGGGIVDQWRITSDRVTGLPGATARHFRAMGRHWDAED